MVDKISVAVALDDSEYYALCPVLPSRHSEGDTFEEALLNTWEVTQLCRETLDAFRYRIRGRVGFVEGVQTAHSCGFAVEGFAGLRDSPALRGARLTSP